MISNPEIEKLHYLALYMDLCKSCGMSELFTEKSTRREYSLEVISLRTCLDRTFL